MPLFKVLMKQESWQEVVVEADDHRDAMDLAEDEINQGAWEVDAPYPLSSLQIEEGEEL